MRRLSYFHKLEECLNSGILIAFMHKSIILAISITVIALSGFLYHEALADTISTETLSNFHLFFKDQYSSNTGWTQIGTQVMVNNPSFPGVVKINNTIGGGGITENRVIKALPSALNTDYWHAKFDYKFTASTIPDSHPFVLTTTSDNPQSQIQSGIVEVRHGPDADKLSILNTSGGSSAFIPISPNTQYYAEVVRMPQQLKLFVFSDPARTINIPGSPVTLHIAQTDYKNLKYIQHDGCLICGAGRTLTAQIDNTIIYSK